MNDLSDVEVIFCVTNKDSFTLCFTISHGIDFTLTSDTSGLGYLPVLVIIISNAHHTVLLQQGPGDELQQRQKVPQTFLFEAQEAQHSTQLLTWHATTLRMHN